MIKNPRSLALSMRKATRILKHAPDELLAGSESPVLRKLMAGGIRIAVKRLRVLTYKLT